jgi:hypothetical protein
MVIIPDPDVLVPSKVEYYELTCGSRRNGGKISAIFIESHGRRSKPPKNRVDLITKPVRARFGYPKTMPEVSKEE